MKNLLTISVLLVSLGLIQACSQAVTPSPQQTSKKTTTNTGGKKTADKDKTDPNSGDSTVDPNDPGDTDTPTDGDGTTDPGTDPDPTEETGNASIIGAIDPNNTFVRIGELTGYAVDKTNLKNFLSVNIYFDGDNKTGTKVGTAKANLYGADDNNGGEHAFIFVVPPAAIDGKPRKVYAYAVVDGKEYPLSTAMPYTLTMYKPKGGSAQTLYNSIGIDSKCKSCHDFNYQNRWQSIVQDGFSNKPWGETTNYFYEKVTTNHGRAKVCSLINCDKIKDWWRAEFSQ